VLVTDELEAAGYRFFSNHGKKHGCKGLYQKKVADKKGVRYYINCFVWDYNEIYQQSGLNSGFTFEVQFSYENYAIFDVKRRLTFNADVIDKIREVEEFFGRIWQTTGRYYVDLA
jgi:hypothetical protein